MKTTLRFWWDDKKSLSLLLIAIMFRLLNSIIVTQITLTIGKAVANLDQLNTYLPMIFMLYLGTIVFGSMQTYCKQESAGLFYTNLMDKYCNKVIDMEYRLYIKYSPAYVNNLSDQIYRMKKIGDNIFYICSSVIYLAVTIIAMYRIIPGIIIPMGCTYFIGMIFFVYIYNKYKNTKKEAREIGVSRFKELEEIINGFQEVRSFDTRHHHQKSLYSKNRTAHKGFTKVTILDIGSDTILSILDLASVVIVILYAAILTRSGSISQAVIMSLIMYTAKLQNPMTTLIVVLGEIAEISSMLPEFEDFMKQNLDIDGNINLDQFEKEIQIKGLSFSYDNSNDVLQNINLGIKKGQKIGICGTSGGGKSTLIKLLNRFYTSYSGSIKIDGIDIKDITAASIRKTIGMVHQENHMFNDTIYNNIKYGSPNATEYEVIGAAKKVSLYDFIQTLPDGFNTMVGNRGLTLSGGQKQKVALARLFLRNPSIILLDEATSALDNESEEAIQDSLKLFKDKTIIAIAHRLSTIADSDTIVVIDGHHIAECGSHDDLMKIENGIYRKLHKISEK